jgi:hypothetical protein
VEEEEEDVDIEAIKVELGSVLVEETVGGGAYFAIWKDHAQDGARGESYS